MGGKVKCPDYKEFCGEMMEARCPMDCSGQGYCMKDNTCQCMHGYFGKDCNTCPGCKKETDKFVTDFEVGRTETPEEKKKREEEERKKKEEEDRKKKEEEDRKKKEEEDRKKKEEEERKKKEEEERKKKEDDKKPRAPKSSNQIRSEEYLKRSIESQIRWEGYSEKRELDVKSRMVEIRHRYYKNDDAYWNEFLQEIKDHQDKHTKAKLQKHLTDAIKTLTYSKRRLSSHQDRVKRYQEYHDRYQNKDYQARMKKYIQREKDAIEAITEKIAFYEDEVKEIRQELAKYN